MVHLGWTEEQFWSSDARTLARCHDTARQHQELLQQQEWERARWLASLLLAPSNKGRQVPPQKLGEFPWELARKPRTKPEHYKKVADGLGRKIKK
jgi:hypothetical protein